MSSFSDDKPTYGPYPDSFKWSPWDWKFSLEEYWKQLDDVSTGNEMDPEGSSSSLEKKEETPVTPPKAEFFADGTVKNLPQTMLKDQFGLAAFVCKLKASKELQSSESICEEVKEDVKKTGVPEGPWFPNQNVSASTVKPFEPSVFAPEFVPAVPVPVYEMKGCKIVGKDESGSLEDKMKAAFHSITAKMGKFNDDLLFMLFYYYPQDVLQLRAAKYLYEKGWHYHKGRQVWLKRVRGRGGYRREMRHGIRKEAGYYEYFDPDEWKVLSYQGAIDLSQLDGPPPVVTLPTEVVKHVCEDDSPQNQQ